MPPPPRGRTTHKGPEATHRLGQTRLRLLIEQLPVVLWTTDRDLRITSALGAGLATLRLTAGDLVGQTIFEYLQTEDPEFPAIAAHRRALEGEIVSYEQLWQDRVYHVTVEPLRLDGRVQGIDGVIGLALDITKRKRDEESLASLAFIVESSDDAIIGMTLEGVITTWNVGAERLYGYRAAEVVGQPIGLIVPADRPQELPAAHELLRRGQRIEPYETMRVRKDGSRFEVAVTMSPVRDRRGRIVGASTITRDITPRRRLEEALREAAVLRSVAHLAAAAAHEINNPLTVVEGYLQLLGQQAHDEATRHQIAEALHAAARIHEIVQRMNRITRLELSAPMAHVPAMLDLWKSSTTPEGFSR